MDSESLARLFPKFHLYKQIYIVVEPSALHDGFQAKSSSNRIQKTKTIKLLEPLQEQQLLQLYNSILGMNHLRSPHRPQAPNSQVPVYSHTKLPTGSSWEDRTPHPTSPIQHTVSGRGPCCSTGASQCSKTARGAAWPCESSN